MGLGTDLLVMCCGWVLFSPLLVLGLITVLPLWCMQSRKKLGRKTRVGVPLPSCKRIEVPCSATVLLLGFMSRGRIQSLQQAMLRMVSFLVLRPPREG